MAEKTIPGVPIAARMVRGASSLVTMAVVTRKLPAVECLPLAASYAGIGAGVVAA
jgi:hypothetical protein